MRSISAFQQYLFIFIVILVLFKKSNATGISSTVSKQNHQLNQGEHMLPSEPQTKKNGGVINKLKKAGKAVKSFLSKKTLSKTNLLDEEAGGEYFVPERPMLASLANPDPATTAGGVVETEEEQFLNPYKGVPSYEAKNLGASSDNFALVNNILGEAHSIIYTSDETDDAVDACERGTLLDYYEKKLSMYYYNNILYCNASIYI